MGRHIRRSPPPWPSGVASAPTFRSTKLSPSGDPGASQVNVILAIISTHAIYLANVGKNFGYTMRPLRAVAAKFRSRDYSTAEAAAITGVPLATANHYIGRELADLGIAVWGDGKRTISYDGLVALRMAWDYPRSMAPSSRVELIKKALRAPRKKHIVMEKGKVIVRVDNSRHVVADGLRRLRQAEALVSVDPKTLGGDPCVKGTRIPVHTIADLEHAAAPGSAKLAYPKLSNAQIKLASLYARAHPRRGRPKRARDVLARRRPKSSKTISVTID
jgi:uncharacterized protein (DUF433 family)